MADSNNGYKVPPNDIQAEQCVLGSCIISGQAVEICVEMLKDEDFYSTGHGTVFRHIKELYTSGSPIDLITLANSLRESNVVDSVGGIGYLASIVDMVPTTANVDYYAGIVSEMAELRDIIKAADIAQGAAYSRSETPDEIKQFLTEFGLRRRNFSSENGWASASDLVAETEKYVENRMKNKGVLSGIPSGYPSIDYHTDGYERGMLTIVASRPSMGKTTYCLNVAKNAAKMGFPVAIFPLEESSLQHGIRLASNESEISMYDLRRGIVTSDEWAEVKASMEGLAGLPIYFNTDHSVNVSRMVSRVQSIVAKYNVQLVIVDHTGEVDVSDIGGNDVKKAGAVAHACKRLARVHNIAVILVSQLSRQVEYREDKRPIMADLRESGELEQKADVVQFLYRPEYYYRDETEWRNFLSKQKRKITPYPTGIVEIITAKGRNIGVDTSKLYFNVLNNSMRELTRYELERLRTPVSELSIAKKELEEDDYGDEEEDEIP